MTNSLTTYRRRGGVALLAGAALNATACIMSVASSASSHVPSDLWRAPMTHGTAIAVYALGALGQALFVAGLAFLWRSGLPRTRPITIGLGVAVVGTVALSVGNIASIAIADQLNSGNAAGWVWSGFAGGSLLAVAGIIGAGISISLHSAAPTWREHAVLTCGLIALLFIVFQVANVIWLAILIYSLGYAQLGAALLTAPRVRRRAVVETT